MISSLLGLFRVAAVQIQQERRAAVETKRFVVLRVIVGGTGVDTLIGPGADVTWNITGLGAGRMNGQEFTALNGGPVVASSGPA